MNLFELFVKIGVDDQASDKISGLSSKLGNGLATAAKIGAAAVGAAAAGITALTTAAVNNYAEYEQLVGGVETLFKTSSDKVMEYAENAYKTAGLSANEYMETVTSFSASLLQSLGNDTEAAVEYADMAITDMSDNANKMGTSMESIQNAYQGFAKQNYTMLDNLKLGYGGTKEEMQRLIADAAELSDTVDAQSMSFDNIVEAIHVVQTEMGITGTTAKEASTTIQGSVSAMKSAWRNLVTGLGDSNADLGKLIDNLVDSATTAFGNILPVAEQAINGIAVLIEKIAPVIAEKLPGLVDQVLPPLLSAAADIVNALVASLPSILQVLIDQAPMIIDTIVSTVISLLPEIIQLGLDLIIALANGIAENLPELIPTIIDVILQIVDTLTEPDNLVALVEASLAIIVALAEGLILSLPKLLEKAPEIIANLVMAIIGAVDALLSAAAEIISTLARGIADGFNKILEKGRELVEKVKQGIKEKISSLLSIGKDIVNGVKNGIANAWDSFTSWVTSKFTGLVNSVKRSLGIASPSKVFASIGGFMAEGLGEGWSNVYSKIKEQIVGDMDFRPATVDFASSGVGRYTNILQSAFGDLVASINQDATIVVQSILDGRIIGETAYKYNLQTRRAYGV